MPELLVNPPFNGMDIAIVRDADWLDAFSVEEADGSKTDLTGVTLDFYVRPEFGDTTLIRHMDSGGGGIEIESPATDGYAHFAMIQATIEAVFPAGSYEQFMVMTTGSSKYELWRGRMIVYPGNTDT
jgi:hypothetical protein